MKPLGRKLIMIGIIAALLIPGCYTTVRHPTDEGDFLANQTSDCVSCHAGYTEFPYGHYYAPTPDYWWDNPRYGEYYTFPWWWSYYEYSYLNGEYGYDSYSGGTKFDEHEVVVTPRTQIPPPPYSLPYLDDNYNLPGPVFIPVNTGGSGGGTSTGARPVTDHGDSRTRDGSTGSSESKETRQSTDKTARPTPQNGDNSSSGQESKPATNNETKSGKKKSRRGDGGGGRL